jgi:hypothetical protein
MTEADIEIILERAKARYPGVQPRIISDNGPQFIAKDFNQLITPNGVTPNSIKFAVVQKQGLLTSGYHQRPTRG